MKVAIVIMIALVFGACNKYHEGPSVSLRSKNARLTGEWKLVNGTITDLYSSGGYESTNKTVIADNEATYTYTNTDGANETETEIYSEQWKIEKDGFLVMNTVEGDRIVNFEAEWFWIDGAFKKSGVNIWGREYVIQRLTNKEMVLMYNYRDVENSTTQNEYRNQYTVRYEFEKL